MRLTNNTDETIELEPGESIDVRGNMETVKLMTARSKKYHIEEVESK